MDVWMLTLHARHVLQDTCFIITALQLELLQFKVELFLLSEEERHYSN